jgi:hypothetical protein
MAYWSDEGKSRGIGETHGLLPEEALKTPERMTKKFHPT